MEGLSRATPVKPASFMVICNVHNFNSQFLCIAIAIRIKRLVQERSGKGSAKKSKRARSIYFTLGQSALQ